MAAVSQTTPTLEAIRTVPKVLLHDHLDGGVRSQTVIDLAAETGYRNLPSHDPEELARHFVRGANRRSLDLYLETFAHTIGVMQTPEALHRVAKECAEDLASDGIVYAEVRFAPELHTEKGLSHDEIVEAVTSGFKEGMDESAAESADATAESATASATASPIRIGVLLTAMRTFAHSLEIAQLAVKWRDDIVVGFDIAGEEAGYPPTRHLDAFHYIQRHNFHFTIHAGESYGPPSIWEAIQFCGAERLGHGVRIIDEIQIHPDGTPELSDLAAFVRDRRIPLEVCPTSNVHTGAAASIAEHPIGKLRDLNYRITVNTDNRLMSDTTLSEEFAACADAFGWTWQDIRWITINAAKSSFIPFDDRLAIINDIIKPGFAHLTA